MDPKSRPDCSRIEDYLIELFKAKLDKNKMEEERLDELDQRKGGVEEEMQEREN